MTISNCVQGAGRLSGQKTLHHQKLAKPERLRATMNNSWHTNSGRCDPGDENVVAAARRGSYDALIVRGWGCLHAQLLETGWHAGLQK